ncbi:septum formation family protein [Micromonospora sp. CPCC 206060]|uniref:septum formation family protein n=1 Tax=Micromonospora sp. CPCC 206060 TaxID=3122406 RepID=UPI002FF2AB61
MRRRSSRTLLGGLVLVAVLAGCAPPAGTDGDLTDDWGAFAQPEPFVPQVGVCHKLREKNGYLTSYIPMECARPHQTETFHVGTFTGSSADRPTPPGPGSPALRTAFTDCDRQATRFVGADWRGGRLSVEVVPPSPANWAGGGRWYRCDLFVLASLETGSDRDLSTDWAGSLRDALKQPSSLRYDCFTEDRWNGLKPVDCTRPHRFEYVGIWTAPFPTYEFDGNPARVHAQCRSVVADFVGTRNHRMGTSFRPPSEAGWERGDRGVRCLLWSDRKDQTRSLRGTGSR